LEEVRANNKLNFGALSRANPATADFLIRAHSLVSTLLQLWDHFASRDRAMSFARSEREGVSRRV
jgi:hypothetical protein